MKKHLKKLVVLLTVIGLVFSLLSGCTKTGNEQAAPKEDKTTEAAQPAQETKEEKPKQKVTLKYITLAEWEKSAVAFIDKALNEKFYKDNPDIKLEYELVPFSDLDKKIITSHAGGVNYDLVLANHPSVGTFAESGILAVLDEYVAKSGIDLEKAYNQSFASSAKYKGKLYAMPFETDCRVLAINKKLFAEAGLEAPKTMEDMLKAAQAITKDTNGDGKPDQYGMIMDFGNMWFPTYDLGQWLLGNGAHLYKQEGDKYVATINSPEALEFLKWAIEMSKYQPNDFVSYDGTKIVAAFSQGKVGMFVFGPWMYNDAVLKESSLEYELVLNPAGKVKSGSSMGGWHIGMGADSKNKDQAWKILEFLAKPEINATTVSALPPIYEAYNYAPYNDPKYKIFAEQLKTAELPNPPIPQLSEIAETWNKYFQRAILKDLSPEDALAGAQKDIQAILDKAGK